MARHASKARSPRNGRGHGGPKRGPAHRQKPDPGHQPRPRPIRSNGPAPTPSSGPGLRFSGGSDGGYGDYWNPCKVERCDFPTPEASFTQSMSDSEDRVDHFHENVHHHTVHHFHHESNQIYTKEVHHYEETDYIHPTEREDLCDGGASTEYVGGRGRSGCGGEISGGYGGGYGPAPVRSPRTRRSHGAGPAPAAHGF